MRNKDLKSPESAHVLRLFLLTVSLVNYWPDQFVLAATLAKHKATATQQSGVAEQQVDEEEREIKIVNKRPSPALEVKFRNQRKKSWLTDLEIEVINITSKPIYYIRLVISFPDVKIASGSYGFGLEYGPAHLADHGELARDGDVPIKPGEKHVFRLPESRAKSLKRYMDGFQLDSSFTKRVELLIQFVNFGDGSAVEPSGTIYRSKPSRTSQELQLSETRQTEIASSGWLLSQVGSVPCDLLLMKADLSISKKTLSALSSESVDFCRTGCKAWKRRTDTVYCNYHPTTGVGICPYTDYDDLGSKPLPQVPCRELTVYYQDCSSQVGNPPGSNTCISEITHVDCEGGICLAPKREPHLSTDLNEDGKCEFVPGCAEDDPGCKDKSPGDCPTGTSTKYLYADNEGICKEATGSKCGANKDGCTTAGQQVEPPCHLPYIKPYYVCDSDTGLCGQPVNACGQGNANCSPERIGQSCCETPGHTYPHAKCENGWCSRQFFCGQSDYCTVNQSCGDSGGGDAGGGGGGSEGCISCHGTCYEWYYNGEGWAFVGSYPC